MIVAPGFAAAIPGITVSARRRRAADRHPRRRRGRQTAVLAALLRAHPRLCSPRVLQRTAAGAAGLRALAAGSVVAVALGAAAAVAALVSAAVTLVGMLAALPPLLGILLDRSRDLSGMSPARWYLGAGSCASWTGYGLPLGRPTVWPSAGFGLLCAVDTPAGWRSPRAGCRLRPDLPAARHRRPW